MSRDIPQVKQFRFDEYQKLAPRHYFRNGFGEDIYFKSEKLFKHSMQGKCSPYLGSVEMSNLCDFENCSHDKAMPKFPYLPYLPNVFVFFINVGHFIILEIYSFI